MLGALAAASLASGAMNTGANLVSQGWSQSFNAKEAQKQRNFEERMSNTQYQRAVADMQAAGINPASLGGSAQTASTPTGSAASGGIGTPGAFNFNNLVSSAMQSVIAKDKNFTDKLRSEISANAHIAASEVKRQASVESTAMKVFKDIDKRRLTKNDKVDYVALQRAYDML